jgi:hypothetical protein
MSGNREPIDERRLVTNAIKAPAMAAPTANLSSVFMCASYL